MKIRKDVRFRKPWVSNPGALAFALLFLLVQFGGTWHLARQNHVLCPQHGDWVDLAGSPRIADAVSSNPGLAHQGPTIDGATAASKVHEHCTLIQASRLRGIDWSPSWSVVPLGTLVAKAQSPIEEPIECGFPIYMLAPKQSPPC